MLQLESVSHVYSFHSYEKNLVRILVPEHLRQKVPQATVQTNNSSEPDIHLRDNVSVMEYYSSTLVFQDRLDTSQFPNTFADFDAQCLEQLLQYQADLYLIGTGGTARFPHRSIHQQIYARKLAIDFMDTGAACRTYNILTGEDRKVAALIFLDQ